MLHLEDANEGRLCYSRFLSCQLVSRVHLNILYTQSAPFQVDSLLQYCLLAVETTVVKNIVNYKLYEEVPDLQKSWKKLLETL